MTRYAERVRDGVVIAGPHVRDACARHLRDMEHGPSRGLSWDAPKAAFGIGFFADVLRLNGGEHEGKPFVLHESQEFIVGSLWGWRRADGTRRFRVAFVETGKGSGKSPLAAGLGIMCAVADGEPRAEVYAAAVDKDQAGILFRDAVAMARQSPEVSERVTFAGGPGREWHMAFLDNGSFFKPISSESSGRGKSGFRPHCVLLDEIHEHPTNAMVEFLRAGTKGRRQPLIFMITNSGYDRTSVCFEYHEYGRKVASGEVEDDSFFSYICALDEKEDPFYDDPDPELGFPRSWLKANPLLGVTFKPAYLEEQVRQAKGMPAKESIVRRLNFCEWVDAENPWIDGDLWRSCEMDGLELPEGAASLGLDLSAKRDLTAVARVVRVDGVTYAEMRFYTPADTLHERELKDRAPYSAWVREGYMVAVPGRSIDYGFVVKDVSDWLSADRASLAFDQWRIEDFRRALDDAGIPAWQYEGDEKVAGEGLRMVRHGQGFGGGNSVSALWMPRSITSLEELILTGKLRVRRNPVLTWNSASAVLDSDAQGNKKWEKRKSTGRIDGIVALCMAVGLAMGTEGPMESVYEHHGIEVF